MNKKSTVNKRFIEVFHELERRHIIHTRAEAARTLDIEPQRLNEILKGRMNVATDVLTNLFIKYHVDPDYIFLGEHPVFRDSKKSSVPYSDKEISTSLLEERDVPYKRKKETIELMVRKDSKDGNDAGEPITIHELAGLLGITDLNRKLDLLLNEKKKGGRKKG
jgi:transcriptional regulator with XRE-family HTH domain